MPRRAVLLLLGVTALLGSTLALAAPARNPQLHYLGGEARTTTLPAAAVPQDLQTPEDLPPPSIRFDRISIADGLSFSKVDAVLQDRQGFLWVGTERGLNKYDGYQFTVYRNDPADPGSLSHDRIYALYEDSAGELWIGTAVGLDRLDRTTGTFVHYQAGLGGNPFTGMPGTGATVLAIQEDRNGVLWVGSTAGLYHLDPGSQAPIQSPAWQEVDEIAENIDGQLWVADINGLYLHNPETDQRSPAGLGGNDGCTDVLLPRAPPGEPEHTSGVDPAAIAEVDDFSGHPFHVRLHSPDVTGTTTCPTANIAPPKSKTMGRARLPRRTDGQVLGPVDLHQL